MESREEITARQYASKIVEVAYYEVMPNKETITNVLEALIIEYSYQQNKQLLDEVDELKSKLILSEAKVKLNYNSIIELQSELKDCTENYNHYVDKCFKLEIELKDKDSDLQHYKKMASNNNHF